MPLCWEKKKGTSASAAPQQQRGLLSQAPKSSVGAGEEEASPGPAAKKGGEGGPGDPA